MLLILIQTKLKKRVSILPDNPVNCALLEEDSRELLEQ
jgi:hypothetical protein